MIHSILWSRRSSDSVDWLRMALGASVLASALGCGGGTSPRPDAADVSSADSGTPEDGPTMPVDVAATCGNGAVDASETCDGNMIPCAMLGASWSSGTAVCRSTCAAWDVSACGLARPGNFETVKPAERDAQRWSTARCNDGTPFTFVVSLAPTPSPIWVVYLHGGVFCDDATMLCSARERALTTTSPAPDRTLAVGRAAGLFARNATTNPTFTGANMVLASYCSSDFWAGATTERRPSTGDPAGWYFSGRANVDALFSILSQRYGLDDGDPSLQVVFSGGSAGAHGAHFNAARAIRELPRTAAAQRLKLFLDAPWMIDWNDPANRIQGTALPDREVWRGARTFWAATFDPVCESTATDPMDCWFGPGWYAAVSPRLPTFVQQCTIDGSFMTFLHPTMTVGTPGVMAWREQITASFAPVTWLFSGRTTQYHTIATSETGYAMGPAGSTLSEMLGRFFNGGAPERVFF